MIAPFEVAQFTQRKLAEAAKKPERYAATRNELTQHEIDQMAADEQFIAWVMGNGYAADHLPVQRYEPRQSRDVRLSPRKAMPAGTDKLLGVVALTWFAMLGERK